MEDLFEVTHETIQLGVRDGNELLYVEKIMGSAPYLPRPGSPAGCPLLHRNRQGDPRVLAPEVVEQVIEAGLTRRTPYTIVSPQLLRECLAQVSRDGVAFDREEAALGLCCAAAPVFGQPHQVIAALSISGSTCR